jgi:hypothetical protein
VRGEGKKRRALEKIRGVTIRKKDQKKEEE